MEPFPALKSVVVVKKSISSALMKVTDLILETLVVDVTVKGTWWVHRVLIRMSFPGLSHVKEHQKLKKLSRFLALTQPMASGR